MHVSRNSGMANEYSRRSPSSGLSSFAVNQESVHDSQIVFQRDSNRLSVIDRRENSRSVDPDQSMESKAREMLDIGGRHPSRKS